ncbi:hypothetical protein [Oceanobacillus chungangensis]|uniref:hypothetical protein n=1 Tax=Oceanobacillus chungangensis TaxID=1229152 RepID=UPI003CCC8A45
MSFKNTVFENGAIRRFEKVISNHRDLIIKLASSMGISLEKNIEEIEKLVWKEVFSKKNEMELISKLCKQIIIGLQEDCFVNKWDKFRVTSDNRNSSSTYELWGKLCTSYHAWIRYRFIYSYRTKKYSFS